MKYLQKRMLLWSLAMLLLIDVGYIVYNVTKSPDDTLLIGAVLLLGLILGALVMTIVGIDKKENIPTKVTVKSHTVVESMRKVFKIITAEGHFNEVYDYQETKKFLSFFPATKKALVIVKGKAQMGYDFSKLKWDINEETRTVKLLEFPEPEILSLEVEPNYYNIEEQFYNLFKKEDLSQIFTDAKQQIREAALQSHLPETAAEQIKTLLREVLIAKDWTLENDYLIKDSIKHLNYGSESEQ